MRHAAYGWMYFLTIVAALFAMVQSLSYIAEQSTDKRLDEYEKRQAQVEAALTILEKSLDQLESAVGKQAAKQSAPDQDFSNSLVEFSRSIRETRAKMGNVPWPSESMLVIRMISSLLARIGVIAIAVYLMQILLTTSRFHSRTAAQYDAMADALELLPNWEIGFDKLVSVLTPSAVFGPSPKFLAQEMAQAMQGLASTVAKSGK